MPFTNYRELAGYMRGKGVTSALFKPLSENDNSKQQIYLGSNFEAINYIPIGKVTIAQGTKRPTYKARIHLEWIDDDGNTGIAEHAQIIMYPKYPEIRLSGFLRGCSCAPTASMHPIPKSERKYSNNKDGRFLILGVRPDNSVMAYLATANSLIAESLQQLSVEEYSIGALFYRIPMDHTGNTKRETIKRFTAIHKAGWHYARRLDKSGNEIEYSKMNCGGYTLEALLGIIPNGRAEPDFNEWEIKSYEQPRITLMTPEPDGGFYSEQGAIPFVLKYGHKIDERKYYFTGTHIAGNICKTTGLRMELVGFDSSKNKITDVNGGLVLVDEDNTIAASWSFPSLLHHWNKKHSFALYVKYKKENREGKTGILFADKIHIGEGTEFRLFLSAISSGLILYDPGIKVEPGKSGNPTSKRRSQFRIALKDLKNLYYHFEEINLD